MRSVNSDDLYLFPSFLVLLLYLFPSCCCDNTLSPRQLASNVGFDLLMWGIFMSILRHNSSVFSIIILTVFASFYVMMTPGIKLEGFLSISVSGINCKKYHFSCVFEESAVKPLGCLNFCLLATCLPILVDIFSQVHYCRFFLIILLTYLFIYQLIFSLH